MRNREHAFGLLLDWIWRDRGSKAFTTNELLTNEIARELCDPLMTEVCPRSLGRVLGTREQLQYDTPGGPLKVTRKNVTSQGNVWSVDQSSSGLFDDEEPQQTMLHGPPASVVERVRRAMASTKPPAEQSVVLNLSSEDIADLDELARQQCRSRRAQAKWAVLQALRRWRAEQD